MRPPRRAAEVKAGAAGSGATRSHAEPLAASMASMASTHALTAASTGAPPAAAGLSTAGAGAPFRQEGIY